MRSNDSSVDERLTIMFKSFDKEGLFLTSKDSPNLVVQCEGKLPSQADEKSVTILLNCHSNNGILVAQEIIVKPRLARMKGMKLRNMRFKWPFSNVCNSKRRTFC